MNVCRWKVAKTQMQQSQWSIKTEKKLNTQTNKQTPTDRNASVSRARAGCGGTEKNDSWSKVSYVNYFMDFNESAHVRNINHHFSLFYLMRDCFAFNLCTNRSFVRSSILWYIFLLMRFLLLNWFQVYYTRTLCK